MRRLLLISNSASPGESYLEKAGPDLNDFLTEADREEVILVPYAAITYSYDEYVSKVN
ncbi:Type 1 glutamine amidotransferase-like domain-containing protein, partial [uncultured Porphyromonas sp.]